MRIFDDRVTSHLDKRDGLYEFLKTPPIHIPPVTGAEYDLMSAGERDEFNTLRLDHLGTDLVLPTQSVNDVVRHVRRALLGLRNKQVGRGGVIVTGAPTTGKTTASVTAMRKVFNWYAGEVPDWEARQDTPIVYVEVPSGATGKAMLGSFLDFFGLPVLRADTLQVRMRLVCDLMRESRTRMFVVDEVHNMARRTNGNYESSQVLKEIANCVNAVPVYVGVNLDTSSIMTDALGQQLSGRSTAVRLRPNGYRTAEDKRTWKSIVHAFGEELHLLNQPRGALVEHADYLWERTDGSINSLSRLLVGATQDLILGSRTSSDEVLTIELMDAIELDFTAETRSGHRSRRKGSRRDAA